MQLGTDERDIMLELGDFLDSLMKKQEESIVYSFWRDARNDMLDMFRAVKHIDDVLISGGLSEKEMVNMDYVSRLFSELDRFCFQDFGSFLKGIGDMREYADLLYMLFWSMAERGEIFAKIVLDVLEYCYIEQDSEEMRQIARDIVESGKLSVFTFQCREEEIECHFDEEAGMYYAVDDQMRIYVPIEYFPTRESVVNYINGLRAEQDERSPHRYFNPRMEVPEGAVVMDAGVAEGNFSVPIIERVKKLYLVECDPKYIRALQWTFKDYMDKVVIVDKFLSGHAGEDRTTIDDIMQGEQLDYLKMDIEGAEVAALRGGAKTLAASPNMKCNICAYHHLHDNERIAEILGKYDMEMENTPGYMLFHLDEKYPYYPRRGLIQAVKK